MARFEDLLPPNSIIEWTCGHEAARCARSAIAFWHAAPISGQTASELVRFEDVRFGIGHKQVRSYHEAPSPSDRALLR